MIALLPLLAAAGAVRETSPIARVPDQLVQHIVRFETHSKSWNEKEFLSFFVPELRQLIERDSRKDDVGYLDGDPFCDCQDPDGLQMRVLSIKTTGTTAVARIQNRFPQTADPDQGRSVVTLHLKRVGGEWKVSDIATKETPSLRAAIRKADHVK